MGKPRVLRTIFLVLVTLILIPNPSSAQALPFLQWLRSFFGEQESPPYTVIREIAPNIEKRLYPAQVWVCTEEFAFPERSDSRTADMFSQIYRYQHGENDMSKKVPMTVPINIKVDHRNGALNAYEMCAYLPSDFQANPPKPGRSTPNMKIMPRSEMKIYSMKFSGFTTNAVFTEKMMELANELKNRSLPFIEQDLGVRALHFNNIYDSPARLWNRRNEVWLIAPIKDP